LVAIVVWSKETTALKAPLGTLFDDGNTTTNERFHERMVGYDEDNYQSIFDYMQSTAAQQLVFHAQYNSKMDVARSPFVHSPPPRHA
jgi:hypothetical protein